MTGLRRTPPRSEDVAQSSSVASKETGGGAIPKTRDRKYANICKEPKFGTTYELPEVDEAEGEDNCGNCKKKVRSDQNGISCDACEQWFHCGCAKVSIDEYKMIQKMGNRITWNCGRCGTSVKEQNEKLKEENRKLIEILKNFEKNIEARLEEFKSEIKNNISNVVKEEIIGEMKEEEEKKKRQKNLVVYKLKESQKATKEHREEEDKNVCLDLMKNTLKVEDCEIEKVIRLGKIDENNRHDRPLLIVMQEKNKKYEVLTNASNLRYCQNEEHRKIYITPDMTIKQREENRKLREELKRRRDNGENWYIKNGKLVKGRDNFPNHNL